MKNFIQEGTVVTLVCPAGGVTSGKGFLVGALFAVATSAAAAGAEVEGATMGVFDLAKDASVFTAGQLAYWNDTTKLVTSTASGNTLIGKALLAAVTGAATVRVLVR